MFLNLCVSVPLWPCSLGVEDRETFARSEQFPPSNSIITGVSKTLGNPDDFADISRRLRLLSEQSVRQWGKLTVNEMLCHLSDGFTLASGELEVESVSTFWSRTTIKWLALRAPLAWPKGVPTVPEIDPRRDGTKPSEFARDHERLEAAAEGRCGAHPFFGSLSQEEWLRWGYLHADHHLRQFGH